MRVPVDAIEAFIVIAELGSFQKAADRLGVTQTALSRRLQRLEAHVGLRLIDRTTRYIGLTVIGRDFLPQARRLIEDLTNGLDRLKSLSTTSSGDVTIACLPSLAYYQLPSALLSYSRKFPGNRVQVLERTGALVTEAVRQGQAELGIHIVGPAQADVSEELLARDPYVLFCTEDHPLGRLDQVTWKSLRNVDLITLGGTSGHRWLIEQHLVAAGLENRGRFVVENFVTAIGLAATGVGAAILPALKSVTARQNNVRQISLVDPVISSSLALTRRRGITLTPAAQALYEHLKRELGSHSR